MLSLPSRSAAVCQRERPPQDLPVIEFGLDRIVRSGGSGIGQESVATGWPAGVRRSGYEIALATEHVCLDQSKSGQLGAEIATLAPRHSLHDPSSADGDTEQGMILEMATVSARERSMIWRESPSNTAGLGASGDGTTGLGGDLCGCIGWRRSLGDEPIRTPAPAPEDSPWSSVEHWPAMRRVRRAEETDRPDSQKESQTSHRF